MTKTNVMAILSLIFSFIFAPIGLVFGFISLNQIKKSGEDGKNLAIAGLVISSVPILVILIITFIGLILAFMRGITG